jgi:hypothetical protein
MYILITSTFILDLYIIIFLDRFFPKCFVKICAIWLLIKFIRLVYGMEVLVRYMHASIIYHLFFTNIYLIYLNLQAHCFSIGP